MNLQPSRIILLFSLFLMYFVSNAQENSKSKHFYPLNDKGIGDNNTVSAGPDNGANNNMGRAFWQCLRHTTTEQAVNNWLSRIKTTINPNNEIELFGNGNLNIGGHGNEGFLETGYGQNGNPDWNTNFLATWNSFAWRPFIEKLAGKNFPIVYIYSCHSGAGERGADFLFQLAQTIGRPVAGRTGFTYSNNRPQVWFENGSVWQVATPDRRPTPIEAPTPHFTKSTQIIFSNGKSMEQLNENEILEVKIKKFELTEIVRTQQMGFTAEFSKSIVKELFIAEPFKIDGTLLAIKTHTISIKTKSRDTPYLFDVYNQRLIGDKFGNYYYLSEAGKAILK